MKKTKLSVTNLDKPIAELVTKTDPKTLAIWAADCAEHVLPFFDNEFPNDDRPRKAIETCRTWVHTGVFKMAEVRKTALAAHAAAREAKKNDAARSAARAAGHSVATAHVPTHSIAAAIYSATAVRDSTDSADADEAALREREWQYRHLLALRKRHTEGTVRAKAGDRSEGRLSTHP